MPRFAMCMFSIVFMVMGVGAASSQDYPNKTIRIVTAPAGGAADFLARPIAQELSVSLGNQVIVDNRPGGVIPGGIVSKSAPDGYTLLCASGILWILPLLQDAPFDPVKDFSPIILGARTANVLVVHPSLPVKTIAQLIALAKARPGEINYSSAATGTTTHLSGELLNFMAGIRLVRIPYKGTVPALTGLMVGEVHLSFPTTAAALPHVKTGRMRALAVTSAEPSVLFPTLPTVAASGLPGYESVSPFGLWAPAKTPRAIIERLNQESVKILTRPDIKERLTNAGLEIVASSPEQFAAVIKADMANMRKVLKAAGIRAN